MLTTPPRAGEHMSTVHAYAALAALTIAASFPPVASTSDVRRDSTDVTLVARDYAFEAPDTLVAGVTSIRMRDEGRDPHHWILFRLADSVSLAEFYAIMQKGGPSPEGIRSMGGAQDGRAVTFDLAEGRYAFGCLHIAATGGSHLSKGDVSRAHRAIPTPGRPRRWPTPGGGCHGDDARPRLRTQRASAAGRPSDPATAERGAAGAPSHPAASRSGRHSR